LLFHAVGNDEYAVAVPFYREVTDLFGHGVSFSSAPHRRPKPTPSEQNPLPISGKCWTELVALIRLGWLGGACEPSGPGAPGPSERLAGAKQHRQRCEGREFHWTYSSYCFVNYLAPRPAVFNSTATALVVPLQQRGPAKTLAAIRDALEAIH
jgi:hypothetical protein